MLCRDSKTRPGLKPFLEKVSIITGKRNKPVKFQWESV